MSRAGQYRGRRTRTRRGVAAVTLALGIVCAHAAAALPGVTRDGWHTWRVPAVADAPGWCCVTWDSRVAQAAQCDLDDDNGYHTASDNPLAAPTHMQIYAQARAGQWQAIRTLRPDCPVTADSPIRDLGTVGAPASVASLVRIIAPRSPLSRHALAAIAVHRGATARKVLLDTAHAGASFENRKDAVFWIGQVRSGDSGADLRRIMFAANDPKMRAHAAFALSQSTLSDKADALIRLGDTDPSADVRAQAWFWLAQTGAPASENALRRAIRGERDAHVREQAIFALSQLPHERGVAGLIELVSDASSGAPERKHALMWLAQSDSRAALDYLERVLGAPAR